MKKKIYNSDQEALGKLDEAVAFMNREKPSAVVELGDFIDQADSPEQELEWLKVMEQHYARLEAAAAEV